MFEGLSRLIIHNFFSVFTLVVFLVILSILVVVHEWGHFAAARKSGMRVYEFGVGFPPRAVGFYRDPATKKIVRVKRNDQSLLQAGGGEAAEPNAYPATVYSLNWLPLGGFCKIKGENGEGADQPDSFGFQAWWKRVLVLVAGVFMNFVLAAALLSIGLSIGIPTDVSQGVPSGAIVVEPPAVVAQEIIQGSPAAEAGLLFGDKILFVDERTVAGSGEFIEYVSRHPDQDIALRVKRGAEEFAVAVRPRPLESGEAPKLGIVLADAAVIRYPWYRALPQGVAAAAVGLGNIFVAVFLLLKGLILGQGLAFDVSGPVGIAAAVGASAKLGIHYLINVTAMISLSLAAMNILPIPALDGGRVLFVLIEKIFRRPVPMRYEQLAHTIGFAFLLLLIIVVTGRDIFGLIGR